MDMTSAARGRGIVERWCILAEQRLEHLTELFETGRWRLYFGEVAFLENIKEAKQAVQTWRDLMNQEATANNRPVDLSWLGQRKLPLQPRMVSFTPRETSVVTKRMGNRPIPGAMESSPAIAMTQSLAPPPSASQLSARESSFEKVPDAPSLDSLDQGHGLAPPPATSAEREVDESWRFALDPAVLQQRYPLLRDAV